MKVGELFGIVVPLKEIRNYFFANKSRLHRAHLFEIDGTADDVDLLDADAPGRGSELSHRYLKLDFSDGAAVRLDGQAEVTQSVFLKRQVLEFDLA